MMHGMTCVLHPADRLCAAIDRVGSPLCVGLDPVQAKFSPELQGLQPLESFEIFCKGVIDSVSGIAASVKFQSACFERLGAKGVALLGELRQNASDCGLQVILDAKRGDIGISAEHYAASATADGPCDWITVNPYLGIDSIEPFLDAGLGVYCLARTSNPSGDAIQKQLLEDGRTVAQSVADLLAVCGGKYVGFSGWSSLGAVVGATKPEEAVQLRKRMPQQMFLMPGIGAQGATAESVTSCFGDGHGALATASRSVIYPPQNENWQTDIAHAAKKLASELQVGMT
ncbi:MAG: orotidine-5'-phosphate decarboxylase [Phycisphaerales bacterium]|nr:orotidine-5'-phosphate decarboxylase [Phycisphaerales bacterium]